MTARNRRVLAEAISLSSVDTRIDAALESVRNATTGYVAIHSAPEQEETTKALFDALATALDGLMAASREVNRLIGELPDE